MNTPFDPKGTTNSTPERATVVLERQAQDMYLKNPNFCPFCHQHRCLSASHPENLGDDVIIQPVTCGSCDAEWNDIFELTSYERVVRN
jgi:hypothetical protein